MILMDPFVFAPHFSLFFFFFSSDLHMKVRNSACDVSVCVYVHFYLKIYTLFAFFFSGKMDVTQICVRVHYLRYFKELCICLIALVSQIWTWGGNKLVNFLFFKPKIVSFFFFFWQYHLSKPTLSSYYQ